MPLHYLIKSKTKTNNWFGKSMSSDLIFQEEKRN